MPKMNLCSTFVSPNDSTVVLVREMLHTEVKTFILSLFDFSASEITLAVLVYPYTTELPALLDAFVSGCICTTVMLLFLMLWPSNLIVSHNTDEMRAFVPL